MVAVPGAEAWGEPGDEAVEGAGGGGIVGWGDGAEWEGAADEGLEGGVAEEAVIDDGLAGGTDGAAAVDEAAPFGSAVGGEVGGVFLEEEFFGFAVADLLAEEGADGGAAVVPDEGSGGEAEAVAGVGEAPAEVDVVAGGAELWVEAADGVEGVFSNSDVAAREVFGFLIV